MIQVGIASDRYYINQVSALLASLTDVHSPGTVTVHYIAHNLYATDIDRINRILDGKVNIIFYSISPDVFSEFPLIGKWTMAAYFRIFFAELLPVNISRLIYLDSDTVVTRKLDEFFNIDLNGMVIGAVYDNYVKAQALLGIPEGEYFNSGVMLIDLDRWRAQGITRKTVQYLNENAEKILYVDQCALNAVLRPNWFKLDLTYNLLYSYIPENISRKKLNELMTTVLIVHYTLERPWNMLCKNRLRSLYSKYLNRAGVSEKYQDFSWDKVLPWILIRMKEAYFDLPIAQKFWRVLKQR
jgi:lipopolysaccharide biosynthesis glycosyltransferase